MKIGGPLRAAGHDVRALAAERALEAVPDESVLQLAATEARILVTRNSRDFVPLSRRWAEANRQHAGVILVWSFSSNRFAEIVAAVLSWLGGMPAEQQWRNVTVTA